jgi:hypothetical protein
MRATQVIPAQFRKIARGDAEFTEKKNLRVLRVSA